MRRVREILRLHREAGLSTREIAQRTGVAASTSRSRWIALQGAANVRDLGGLPLRGGGATAPGVLLRADNLQGLTAPDVRRLVGNLERNEILRALVRYSIREDAPREPVEVEETPAP